LISFTQQGITALGGSNTSNHSVPTSDDAQCSPEACYHGFRQAPVSEHPISLPDTTRMIRAMTRLGMLTPSSNTVLEPMTYAMLAADNATTAHFSRFKVTEIALSDTALGQFTDAPILAAAELLAHAKCDVIAWNGTSASWLGFDRDEALVEKIEAATGIRAATCVLGYRDLFRALGTRRIGLVTPYTSDVQMRIAANWARSGFECVSERHRGMADNFSFANVDEPTIERMIREAAVPECDAVAIVCTNMRGARVAARLEAELGLPILDSVAVTLWAALKAAGAPTTPYRAWGKVFAVELGS
jgi:maleate isomerase